MMDGEKTINSVIGDALGKMSLSLIALIALAIFSDATEKYGWPQVLTLLALHAIGLTLLWKSATAGDSSPAIGALFLGVAWNLGAILYMLAESGPKWTINGWVDTSPPTTEVVGTVLLTWWYVASIRKLRKFR